MNNNSNDLYGLLIMVGFLGFIGGVLLICYENGKPFGLFRRMRCKAGKHRMHRRIGRLKIAKYHCLDCKVKRKHPNLQIVDGGRRDFSNFKF